MNYINKAPYMETIAWNTYIKNKENSIKYKIHWDKEVPRSTSDLCHGFNISVVIKPFKGANPISIVCYFVLQVLLFFYFLSGYESEWDFIGYLVNLCVQVVKYFLIKQS